MSPGWPTVTQANTPSRLVPGVSSLDERRETKRLSCVSTPMGLLRGWVIEDSIF